MCIPGRNPNRLSAIGIKLETLPCPESRRVFTHINNHIKQAAPHAVHQLSLLKRRHCIVQSAQCAGLAIVRKMHALWRDPWHIERTVPRRNEPPTLICKHCGSGEPRECHNFDAWRRILGLQFLPLPQLPGRQPDYMLKNSQAFLNLRAVDK